MNTIKILCFAICALITTTTFAQQSEGVKKEGAHQAEYNADAQDRDNSGEIDSRQNGEANNAGTGDAGEQTNFGATVETVIITPAGTRTTSPSGSPGILMEDPSTLDGTNTRQSAKPNIAGSPVPGATTTNESRSQSEDFPDNKIFSGEKQKAVPMNAREKQDSNQQDKKGAQTDEMQKG